MGGIRSADLKRLRDVAEKVINLQVHDAAGSELSVGRELIRLIECIESPEESTDFVGEIAELQSTIDDQRRETERLSREVEDRRAAYESQVQRLTRERRMLARAVEADQVYREHRQTQEHADDKCGKCMRLESGKVARMALAAAILPEDAT